MKDDTISREAVEQIFSKMWFTVRQNQNLTDEEVKQIITKGRMELNRLPSAQPECEDAVSREKVAVHIARTNAVQKMSMTDWNEILDALETVPLVTPKQPGWIPCSERLPYAEYGESDNVLTTCGYRDVEDTSVRWIRLLYLNGGNWCYPTGETYEAKVYAWMPLPPKWEGGQE